jgi:DtxR family manganese transport transcriptional regulator
MRRTHENELIEDYVRLIAELIDARGEARLTDLADRRGVRPATASKMVRRLLDRGLVESAPYRAIHLTDAGQDLADACRMRHDVVVAFLRALGVPQDEALRDAEGIEHHVGATTLSRMRAWLDHDR